MTGYIIDPRMWSTLAYPIRDVTISSYTLPIESSTMSEGSVTIPSTLSFDPFMFLFRVELYSDRFWVISKSSVKDNITTLTLQTPISLMNNYSYGEYDNTALTLVATVIHNGLTPGYAGTKPGSIASWSPRSRMTPRYIYASIPDFNGYDSFAAACTVEVDDSAKTQPTTKFIGYNLYTIIQQLVDNGWLVSFDFKKDTIQSYTGGYLIVTIKKNPNTEAIPVYFNDGHSTVKSESYDDDVTSCIYLYDFTDKSVEFTVTSYRLQKDGSIVQELQGDNNEVTGDTMTAYRTSTDQTALEYCRSIFDENTHSHKVEFYSDKVFHAGQPVTLMLDRGTLNTAISKVTIQSSDDRYLYTCGELPATATDMIRASNWKYGVRYPYNPKKGQLFFM